ncbi:hypothetical protein AB3N62_05695 [Leptospira sp. WS4.C2]
MNWISERLLCIGDSEKSLSSVFAKLTISGEFLIFRLISQTWMGSEFQYSNIADGKYLKRLEIKRIQFLFSQKYLDKYKKTSFSGD